MISTNPWLQGATGRAGNMVVKNYNGKIVLSARPDMSKRKLSKKQQEFNDMMKFANTFAKSVMKDPKRKEEACATLRVPANKVYRALIKEYILKKGDTDKILQSYVTNRYKNTGLKHEQYIESNPSVLDGKPVIKGTTVAVETILQRLSYGSTIPEILEEYPAIKTQAILAALAYASDIVASNR